MDLYKPRTFLEEGDYTDAKYAVWCLAGRSTVEMPVLWRSMVNYYLRMAPPSELDMSQLTPHLASFIGHCRLRSEVTEGLSLALVTFVLHKYWLNARLVADDVRAGLLGLRFSYYCAAANCWGCATTDDLELDMAAMHI